MNNFINLAGQPEASDCKLDTGDFPMMDRDFLADISNRPEWAKDLPDHIWNWRWSWWQLFNHLVFRRHQWSGWFPPNYPAPSCLMCGQHRSWWRNGVRW